MRRKVFFAFLIDYLRDFGPMYQPVLFTTTIKAPILLAEWCSEFTMHVAYGDTIPYKDMNVKIKHAVWGHTILCTIKYVGICIICTGISSFIGRKI